MTHTELVFRRKLDLIKTVFDHMSHVQDLHTLAQLMEFGSREYIICETTINSRHDYKLYRNHYNNPDDHIDRVLSIMDTPIIEA